MKITKMKNIIVLAALMIFAPALSLAQTIGSDGPWNSSYEESDGNSYEKSDGKVNKESGETKAPLGGGIAILAASAAGYTILKKRKNNK